MNKILIFIAIVAAAGMLFACKTDKKECTKPVYVTDDCDVVTRINPDEKTVYLVFTAHYSENDSGYFENFDGLVPVLDTLKEKGVKGSFFPTGVCFTVDRYQEPIKRIIDEGHYLSSHSFAHLKLVGGNDSTLISADSIKADFARMEQELERFGLTKEQYNWLIPPYESYNQETANVMKELGYRLMNPTPGLQTGMDWTSPGAANYHSVEMILENLWQNEAENTFNGQILLIHAMNYPDRTDADRPYTYLGEIIDKLKEKGYSFKSIFDVIEAEKAANAKG